SVAMPRKPEVCPDEDGIDRRSFLDCMRWAGTGLVWTLRAGVPMSGILGAQTSNDRKASDFSFVQISDSHIGFNRPANTDVKATLQAAVDRINDLPQQPDSVIHTGDITHLAKTVEFD